MPDWIKAGSASAAAQSSALLITVLSGLLALGMVVAVPMSLDRGAGDVALQRNLEQGREALKDARAFRADPCLLYTSPSPRD